jgi:altronate dehydratase
MTIEQVLLKIKDHLDGIDIKISDNRKLLTKLIHQIDYNTDVLKRFTESNVDMEDDFFDMIQLMSREMNALKKLEQELKKHGKKLTPGIMGES